MMTPMQRLRLAHELASIDRQRRAVKWVLAAVGILGFLALCALPFLKP